MLRVLRQFVHAIQNHFDHRGSLRLLISQEVETHETSAPTIRTIGILQRIYAAEGSQPGLFYPAVVIFAFVAGLVLGTIF